MFTLFQNWESGYPFQLLPPKKNARREVGPMAPSRPPTPAPENVGSTQ